MFDEPPGASLGGKASPMRESMRAQTVSPKRKERGQLRYNHPHGGNDGIFRQKIQRIFDKIHTQKVANVTRK